MYKILFISLIGILPISVFSQVKQKNISVLERDTITAFEIQYISVDSSKNKINRKKLNSVLQYDFVGQYPFYTTDKMDWKTNDQFTIKFNQIPDSGFVYVFTLDGRNTPRLHFMAKLDSLKKPLNLPDTTKALTLTQLGDEYLCIWFSKNVIPQHEKLINGIEMTRGTFMERTAKQIGERLIYPAYNWNFLPKEFAIITKDTTTFPINGILPIIVRFNVIQDKSKNKKR